MAQTEPWYKGNYPPVGRTFSLQTVASRIAPLYIPRMFGQADTDNTANHLIATGGAAVTSAFEIVDGDIQRGLILLCDHATNILPAEYGTLGLSEQQLSRHIAYDIGVEQVTRELAELLGVPAVLSRFSRLLIDPNRGLDDPTLVMRLSDGAVVPGNAAIDQLEIDRRVRDYYLPYDGAVRETIDRSLALDVVPALLSIHSFTPVWRGSPRPWHAGVLWDSDDRFVRPLIAALASDAELVVGDNEPYSGELEGDMMNRQGTKRGLAHALLEIRQDLIAGPSGATAWAERLATILPDIIAGDELHHILVRPA